MGADIHSRAEIRLNGEWQMLGDIFPETSSMRWIIPDREYLEDLSDAELFDAIDFYVANRKEYDEKGEQQSNKLPSIPRNSELEEKILAYNSALNEKLAEGREGAIREQIMKDENGEYDPDGWTRWAREVRKEVIKNLTTTMRERKAVIDAILNFRNYTREEWENESWLKDRYQDFDNNPENRIQLTEHKTSEDDQEWFHNEPLHRRNYSLFAVLAGVRNYTDGVTPISPPKGTYTIQKDPETGEWVGLGSTAPEDASEEVKRFQEHYMGVDGHSHSWLSLRELLDYDFEDAIEYEGIITVAQYKAMKAAGWPEDQFTGPGAWSQSVGDGKEGERRVVFTAEAYEKWVQADRPRIKVYSGGKNEFGFIDGPQVLPEDVPDENPEGYLKVDLWADVYGYDEKQIARLEKDKRDHKPDRYSYNGIIPLIYASWKEKRVAVMGEEFRNMMRIFTELVEINGITEDDVRVIFHFDN